MTEALPTTVLSGFLGAGKTSVLNHVLANLVGRRVAVIVNDMSAINIDAALVSAGQAALRRGEDRLVELTNGCICCTLRDDLLVEVARLARAGRFDHLLIESTGISEPLPVAATFTFATEDGTSLADVARLDTMATVVDASAYVREIRAGTALVERGLEADVGDVRTVADLLVDQVEVADLLIINKTDLVDGWSLLALEEVLRRLNPRAHIVHAVHGQVDPTLMVGADRFDLEAVAAAPGWAQAISRDDVVPETDEYNISSTVYRARRPFHPGRLWSALAEEWPGLLRSKGFFWVASRPDIVGVWSSAGPSLTLEPGGIWVAATASDPAHVDDPLDRADLEARWDPYYGDRATELAFIGVDLDHAWIGETLDTCLLTDLELADGEAAWRNLDDPLPAWDTVTELALHDHDH